VPMIMGAKRPEDIAKLMPVQAIYGRRYLILFDHMSALNSVKFLAISRFKSKLRSSLSFLSIES